MEQSIQKKFLVSVIILIGAGVYLGFFYKRSARTFPPGVGNQRMTDLVVREVLPDAPVFVLSGTVVALGADKIQVEVSKLAGLNLPAVSELRMREVRITPATRVIARMPKTTEELNRELHEFSVKGGALPEPYALKEIPTSSLVVGDSVAVQGAGGGDIKLALTIDAATITKTNP